MKYLGRHIMAPGHLEPMRESEMVAQGLGYCMGQLKVVYIHEKNNDGKYRFNRIGRMCSRCQVVWIDSVWIKEENPDGRQRSHGRIDRLRQKYHKDKYLEMNNQEREQYDLNAFKTKLNKEGQNGDSNEQGATDESAEAGTRVSVHRQRDGGDTVVHGTAEEPDGEDSIHKFGS